MSVPDRRPLPRSTTGPRVVWSQPATFTELTYDEYEAWLDRNAEERYAHERDLDERDRHMPERWAA